MKIIRIACYVYWFTASFIVVLLASIDFAKASTTALVFLLASCIGSLAWILHAYVPPDEVVADESYWYEDESYASDLDWWGRP